MKSRRSKWISKPGAILLQTDVSTTSSKQVLVNPPPPLKTNVLRSDGQVACFNLYSLGASIGPKHTHHPETKHWRQTTRSSPDSHEENVMAIWQPIRIYSSLPNNAHPLHYTKNNPITPAIYLSFTTTPLGTTMNVRTIPYMNPSPFPQKTHEQKTIYTAASLNLPPTKQKKIPRLALPPSSRRHRLAGCPVRLSRLALPAAERHMLAPAGLIAPVDAL